MDSKTTLLIVLILGIMVLIIKNQLPSDDVKNLSTTTTIAEIQISEIIEKIKNESPELEIYLNYPAKITLLYDKDLDELSLKQPAIYSGLEEPIYRVEFLNDKKTGLLILYDPKREIVRKFEVKGLVL